MIASAVCADPGCEARYQPHRWGSIKAHATGWFIQKDGTAWCPEHVPDWVEAWRSARSVPRET